MVHSPVSVISTLVDTSPRVRYVFIKLGFARKKICIFNTEPNNSDEQRGKLYRASNFLMHKIGFSIKIQLSMLTQAEQK